MAADDLPDAEELEHATGALFEQRFERDVGPAPDRRRLHGDAGAQIHQSGRGHPHADDPGASRVRAQ